MDSHFNRYKIEDRSYIAFIKREIHLKAVGAKFDKIAVGKIDIIVSEVTSNLIKHATEGELLYRISINTENLPTFEVICIDKGPGIADMASAMRDGSSTKGTIGGGLGAMQRMSSLFHIFSMRQWGTVLYSKVGPEARVPEQPRSTLELDVKAVCVPKTHEEVCGDGYRVVNTETHTKILFGDGLGHGPHAKEAVDMAGNFFSESEDNEPVEIIRRMHEQVRRTRGLVATVVVIDKKAAKWHLCGVGNINVRLYSGIEYRNYMSYNGTVGLNIPKSMNSTVIPLERNQHLIMCSDGVTTRWNLGAYTSIFKYDANVLAGVLYKDFSRGTDDTSILIAKVI